MFTGIVSGVGRIVEAQPLAGGSGDRRIRVDCGDWPVADVALGDSICHNGVCLTVVAQQGNCLDYDVSAHTLSLVCGLEQGAAVNLEKSLRAGDRLGGHYVSGHVDGTGRVTQWQDLGDSWLLEVEVPQALGRFIAVKGSVAVHGVSLTVNAVTDADGMTRFALNIIPHTRAVTSFATLRAGDRVNVEVDMLARYVARQAQLTIDPQ